MGRRWRLIVARRRHVVAVWMRIKIQLLEMLLFGHALLLDVRIARWNCG